MPGPKWAVQIQEADLIYSSEENIPDNAQSIRQNTSATDEMQVESSDATFDSD